jgi:hypothetical protein
MYPIVEAWSKEQGCSAAQLLGRKGWMRTFLHTEGWAQPLVFMIKEYGT